MIFNGGLGGHRYLMYGGHPYYYGSYYQPVWEGI
jgi:hypothetical protein